MKSNVRADILPIYLILSITLKKYESCQECGYEAREKDSIS